MPELDDLIRFENENTSLDFKATQYLKPVHEQLLKDLLAMANADVRDDRYIVVGVEHKPDGSRNFLSINKADFIDSAIYQQLVRENIEPEIHFEYLPYDFEGHLLGVFRIYDCVDKPYMMRKDFKNLKQGNAFIRKGSHQPPLTRKDLDHIREKQNQEFSAAIRIGFDVAGLPNRISVQALGEVPLPSDEAANRIRNVLAEREQKLPPGDASLTRQLIEAGFPNFGLGPVPYSHRSSEQLRENLRKVKDTYREDDLFELYEQHASRINFLIFNEGDSYIEDALVQIRIPKVKGVRIAPKIYLEPDRSGPFAVPRLSVYGLGRHYPNVTNYKDYIGVLESVGTLRHGIAARAFQEPLRIVFGRDLVGQELALECTLRAKQLRTPREQTLTIEVTEA